MKALLALLLAVALVGLVAGYYYKSRSLEQTRRQVAESQKQADDKALEAEVARIEKERAETQQKNLVKLADQMVWELKARRAATNIANPPAAVAPTSEPQAAASDKGGFGAMLSKMMADPDTRKFIREQQRMMIEQLYSPLVKKLGLSPEESQKFKDLLADNMVNAAEKATSMFGQSGAADQKERIKTLGESQKAFDEQVRAFLGEDRYPEYKSYTETVQERTALNMFRQQNSDLPLTEQQTDQLLTIMKEEKANAFSKVGQAGPSGTQDEAGLQALFSDEQGSKMLQAQEEANARVLQRANSVLSEDQIGAFGRFQTNQLQMMRMGLSMARKMMGGSQETTPPALEVKPGSN